jgi:XTP/dITP diphosphohydrolase
MLIIATHNAHKLQEISEILAPLPCIGAKDFNFPEPEETGLSFIENALIKARFLSQQTQKPVIADDSGLVVPALNGAPGIYSARYAGPKANDASNRQLLLTNMQGISERFGYFYCAMVYIRHAFDPSPLIGLGQWNGRIIEEERGSNGFGYDPIFYIDSQQCTAAELPAKQKNSLSHRGQALTQLKQQLIHHGILSIP